MIIFKQNFFFPLGFDIHIYISQLWCELKINLPYFSLHQRSQEAQSCCRDLVADRWIILGIIITTVAIPNDETDGAGVPLAQQYR